MHIPRPFERKNPPAWLTEPDLRAMYERTTGPYGSPDPVECWVLHHLATQCIGDAIEFGSWRGRSACFIASGLPDGSRLWAVDHFAGDDTGGSDPDRAAMDCSLAEFGLSGKVDIHGEDMHTFTFPPEPFGLAFYDADHRADPTVALLTRLHPHLCADARIVIHDAGFEMTSEAITRLSPLYTQVAWVPVWEGLAILTPA